MLTGIKLVQNNYTAPYNAGIKPIWDSQEKQMLTEIKLVKIHTAPYNAGIEPVWYSQEKQMLTRIKLVQTTRCTLQYCYRTGQVFTRKTNAKRNQTGTKYTLFLSLIHI